MSLSQGMFSHQPLSDEESRSLLEFHKKQYEKILLATNSLANQSCIDYVDEYEALTKGFYSEADIDAKLELPNRWGTSDELTKQDITATEQDDSDLKIKNDKKWAYKKIHQGEFHTYFENSSASPKKYLVPKEKRSEIFNATINAMCASKMMSQLKPGGKIPSTIDGYKDAVNNAIDTYKEKQDIHKTRNDLKTRYHLRKYTKPKDTEKKSFQDYMQAQKKNPIAVFLELTIHAVLSILTIGSGVTLDLATDCQKMRGHLRFWDKVTDDMDNAINEVDTAKQRLII